MTTGRARGMAAPALALALAAACGERRTPDLIVASGHVEAIEVRVSTKVAGRVARLDKVEGDTVTAGTELARLDTTDLELARRVAAADRGQAQADLDLRLAGSRSEDIDEARAQVARADAEREGAQKDLVRMQELLDAGMGTAQARDEALARRDATVAEVRAARERLRKLQAGSRLQEIESARARVLAADARIAQLDQQIKDATISSPVSGIVTAKLAEAGELLSPGAGVCVVTDLAGAWLNVYVAEPDLGRIRLGQEAEVRTDGGQVRRGHITFVSSQAEFTPRNVQTRDERVKLVYKVKVGLDNTDGLFKPGMPAEARIAPARAGP
jgi:membrane fusion protein YbhG